MMDTLVLDAGNPRDIERAGALLQSGALVAMPTETVYGLAGNALNPAVSAEIYRVKGRPSDNPLIVHIADIAALSPLVESVPEAALKLADAFWPGPLTIILKKSGLVPKETTGGLDTVAVRMPAHPAATAMIRAAGVPLAAPSANLSGLPSPTSFQHVCDDLMGRVAAIVNGGDCAVGVESTVLTLATEKPRVLRPGGVSVEALRAVLGEVEVDPAVLSHPDDNAPVASPGMKYKHYAPNAEITVVDASLYDYADYVNQNPDATALCFHGEEQLLHVKTVPFGDAGDALSQAHSLFAALHTLDAIGAKTVLARMPKKSGVGLAVYNRLIRAAAFRIKVPRDVFVIGLTGQTGAGKSTVGAELQKLGCAVIDCDEVTRDPGLYTASCLERLQNAFGSGIMNADGTLNRRALADIAFQTKAGRDTLNSITHPVIFDRIRAEIDGLIQAGYRIVVLDAPTLFEAKADRLCRRIISVTADRETRIARVMARDGLTHEQALWRCNAQQTAEFYTSRSDRTLDNTVAISPAEIKSMLEALTGADGEAI